MAELTTKQKIAAEALTLFSGQGYDAVSVRDIARAVGIKESSLYNHFKNKQDIFDSIVNECARIANEFFESLEVNASFDGSQDDNETERFENIGDEEFLSISIGVFQFYLQEENLVKFRRMLTIEQFNNIQVGELFRKVFIDNMINFQVDMFEKMMESHILIETDPYLLAMQFYGPVFMMFYQYTELTDEATDLLIRHVIQFKETYSKK